MNEPTPSFGDWLPWKDRAEARKRLRDANEGVPATTQYGGCYLFGHFDQEPPRGPAKHTLPTVIYIGETQNLLTRPLGRHEVAKWHAELHGSNEELHFALITIDEWFYFKPKHYAYLDWLEARMVWEYVTENNRVPQFQLTGPLVLRRRQQSRSPRKTTD